MYIERDSKYGINRVFDPVQKYKDEKLDCISTICTFLQTDGLRRVPIQGIKVKGRSEDDFKCLKINIDRFSKIKPSKKHIRMELIIIVNGYISDNSYITYLSNLDNKWITDDIKIRVFQRSNMGWKWGALWDIWNGYKDGGCNWWLSIENDLYINMQHYFDICTKLLLDDSNSCWISYIERTTAMEKPYEYYGNLPQDIWRDKNNKPLHINSRDELHCSGGSFHFIKRKVLEDIENIYGNFTYAIGDSYELDAIVHGEIGFFQKAKALGYRHLIIPDIVIPDKREKYMYKNFLDCGYKDILE